MKPTNSPNHEVGTPSVDGLTPPATPPQATIEELAALLSAGNVEEFNQRRPQQPLVLEGLTIRDKVLDGVNLSHLKFSQCSFERCSFARANLSYATASLSSIKRCSFPDAQLNWLKLRNSELIHATFERANTDNLSLSSCTLQDTLFVSGSARGLSAICSTISDTRFDSVQANLATFQRCDLVRTVLRKCNLIHASFRQSRGSHVNFSDSLLHHANFTDSQWTSVFNLKGAYILSGQFSKDMFDAFAWQDGTVLKPAIIDDAPPPKAFAPTPTKPPTVKTAIDDIPGTDHELYLSALARLEKLEGLDDVKREVRELVALLRVSRVREQHGSTEEPPTLHYIFAGDPGTGKTTVARIVADLLKSLGYLKQGQCIETDRAGLVAAYTGQTALKTHDIIESAIGGVLFIDEAYTLTPEDRLDPYGPEAIATLLKEMEDRRHDFVVIAAGYTSEMKRFLESNPGLQSRFSQKMTFASLSRTELERVFDSLLQTGRFTADDETRRGVGFLAEKLRASTGESFGNARTIRTIFEKMRRRQSVRITTNGMPTEKEDFYKLILADIPSQEMIGLSPEQLRAQLDKKGFFIASPGAGSILGNPAGPGSTHLN